MLIRVVMTCQLNSQYTLPTNYRHPKYLGLLARADGIEYVRVPMHATTRLTHLRHGIRLLESSRMCRVYWRRRRICNMVNTDRRLVWRPCE
jgi:hypothetical protein